ncbi:MAG: terminase small subunit [Deltaproteobacteria bacterium]|nr:terminase small subunit [Deltaproteobacteria bacterium]
MNGQKKTKKTVKKTVKKTRKKRIPQQSSEIKKIEFARYYFASKTKNAVEAFVAAGFSEKGASANASRLLRTTIVKKELARLAKKQEDRLEIKADQILKELLKSATSDIRDIFDDNGLIKNPKEWPDHIAKAVSSLQIEEIKEWDDKARKHVFVGYSKKIKLWDKIKSLELVGKHLKLFQENVTVTITTDIIERMNNARKRTILDE